MREIKAYIFSTDEVEKIMRNKFNDESIELIKLPRFYEGRSNKQGYSAACIDTVLTNFLGKICKHYAGDMTGQIIVICEEVLNNELA